MTILILAFNIRQSVYRQFGLELFRRAAASSKHHLLPIVTLPEDGIQQRALRLSKDVPELLAKLNVDKAHFACYSSSGIDFRFAISELGLDKYTKTLTTISSPHQYTLFYNRGSKLASLSDRKAFKADTMDPVSRLSGVGLKAFHQFVPENMRHFNNFVKDAEGVEYYSFGSERLPSLCSETLSQTGKYLFLRTESNYQYHNDGVFGHDQIKWGKHVANFQADHGEVIGLYGPKSSLSLKAARQIAEDWEERHETKERSTETI